MFRNRERFVKFVVWAVVLSMLLALVASLASVLS